MAYVETVDFEPLGNGEDLALAPQSGYYESLLDRYAGTVHGEHHATQPLRYEGPFGCYDREQMLVDCGPDVHPVEHMRVTLNSLQYTLKLEDLSDWSPFDVHAVNVAAALHDTGECTHEELVLACGRVVGDIAQGSKTPEDRAAETKVRQKLIEWHFPELSDDIKGRIEALITHEDNSKVHAAFEVAHDSDTYCMGLRVARLALRGIINGETGVRQEQLHRMAKPIVEDAAQRLEHHALTFAYPLRMLESTTRLRERIMAEL